MARRWRGSRLRRPGRILAGVLIFGWTLIPIYWALVVSLMKPVGLESTPPSLIPRPFTLDNYRGLLNSSAATSGPFLHALRNSAIEAVGTTVLTVTLALLAGYAFARWQFPGSNVLFLAILATIALPLYAVLIPLFQKTAHLHQVDTYKALILINASASLPLATWLLRSHIATIPQVLEEAARVDGAGVLKVIWRITVPLIAPGLTAAAVFVFLTTWAAYLVPLAFAPTLHSEPITVLIPQYATRYSQNYGLQAAAGLLALLPPAAVVIWLNRYLLHGLLSGAVSG
jgi:multiple sugar transport system permease protein